MKNIFEGAKFGDKFVTRDGRIALLIFPQYFNNTKVTLCVEEGDNFECYLDGNVDNRFWKDNLSIVEKWREPIDEEKLDELANEYVSQFNSIEETTFCERDFKAGYRKAKEE